MMAPPIASRCVSCCCPGVDSCIWFLLQVLSSYVNPGGLVVPDGAGVVADGEDGSATENNSLPAILPELLSQSCLVPAISSYLRNDSGR